MNKIALICLIILGFVVGHGEAMPLDPGNFSLSGGGHSRWAVSDSSAPYHAANVFDLFGSYQTENKNLKINTRLTFESPSTSHEYLEKQKLLARMSVVFRKEWAANQSGMIKAGDLGEITIGRGLTLKDMESMGFILDYQNPMFTTSLTYIGRGYSQYGDYAILDIHTKNPNPSIQLGAYYFWLLTELRNQNKSGILSLYADVPIQGVTVNIEAATNTAPSPIGGVPAAFLIHSGYQTQDSQTRFSLSTKARYYSAAFNSYLNNPAPHKNFHALEEEDEDADNWRNTLVNTNPDFFPQSEMWCAAIRVKGERQLWDQLWSYGDIEWVLQAYQTRRFGNIFYKYGIQYEWAPDQLVYLGIQNKVFSTSGQEDYPPLAPVFMSVPGFVVTGLKYRF